MDIIFRENFINIKYAFMRYIPKIVFARTKKGGSSIYSVAEPIMKGGQTNFCSHRLASVLYKNRRVLLLIVLLLAFFSVYDFVPVFNDLRASISMEEQVIDGSIVVRTRRNSGRNCKEPTVAMMTILKDHRSWGENRGFLEYFEIIGQFQYPAACISINLLVSDEEESKEIYNALPNIITRYRSVTLVTGGMGDGVDRDTRHRPELQKNRRRTLAMLRNQLLLKSLRDEDYVAWIDADVTHIPGHLLHDMIDSKKDIVIPRCNMANNAEYDANTWKRS